MKESFCSCCGVSNFKYNFEGHAKECIWHDEELYRLANEWLNRPEYKEHPFKIHIDDSRRECPMILRTDWKKRYDLIVKFLLSEINYIKGK